MTGGGKSIAAISMVRNGGFFVDKWISYYGQQLGQRNLYLVVDGHDQPLPNGHEQINVIRMPHIALSRAKGDRNRSRLISHIAKALFHRYDIVIAHDIDELLVVDPKLNQTLHEYLQKPIGSASLSGLGLDVGQHPDLERPIDPTQPFLRQRSFAHVSARYTKPAVATRPVTWGSGFHRVKYHNFHIDPNLFLFHFGMIDYNTSKGKTNERNLLKAGWKGHFGRRLRLFELIQKAEAIDGDSLFKMARVRQRILRPIYALNKPGMLFDKPIIRIPERFKPVV